MSVLSRPPLNLLRKVLPSLHTTYVLTKQGVVRPMRPDKLVRVGMAFVRWGVTPPLGFAVGAVRHPDRPAVIDERGALSYAELDQRTNRLATALRERLKGHSAARIGVLCRNHHGLLETLVAAGKLGVDVVLLNTGLSEEQLGKVIADQQVGLLIVDQEFTSRLPALPAELDLVLAWTDGTTRHDTLAHLITITSPRRMPRPRRHSRMIVLTSGTTGTPKGAKRPDPPGLAPAATLLSRIPLRAGERILLSAPLFHTWGIAAFQLGAVLGATFVLRRKFEPAHALTAIQRHQCSAMFAVPVMLQRILELPELAGYDTSSLRIVASSGSALPADLAARFQRAFGPVLYNLYGSTEVSWVSIATPADLRAAPGTAGKPPRGTVVRILNEAGAPVSRGKTGRIFAGNEMLFDGYTNGTAREVREGLMSTGDMGRFDHSGRLFIVGREDDMIISGGENVYPKETEDAIAKLPEVAEAAVIGVDDADFGQRPAAFVVLHEDSRLDADQVRERIKDQVAKFAMPRDVVFLDELPRNATGKVVPRELLPFLES